MAKKRKTPLYQSGDVFAVPLPSGWWGAVRVFRRDDERIPGAMYLVATTPYLGKELPNIDDPRLKQILARHYFSWAGERALVWLHGPPPDTLRQLGNLPLNEDEALIEGKLYGSYWKDEVNDEAYDQWRWDNDRDAFIEEVNKEGEERRATRERNRLKQKPKKMLPDDDFWALIALLGQPGANNEEAREGLERLISALAKRTRTDIKRFEETLAYKLFLLDTEAHAQASDNSDDGFLYARCAVVASGPAHYQSVLADPAATRWDREFEDLLAVAPSAYERKTGEDFDYVTGCSYETGSNPTGWPPSGELDAPEDKENDGAKAGTRAHG
jgi:hypothetical protein